MKFSRMRLCKVATTLSLMLLFGVACSVDTEEERSHSAANEDQKGTVEKQQKAPAAPANPYLTQIPQFPQAPTPHRVTLPADNTGVPVIRRVPTNQPVAFITIDDGNVAASEGIELLSAESVPASAFLVSRVAALHSAYFGQLRDVGVRLQAHTRTHPNLRGKSLETQKREICGSVGEIQSGFGARPTLFRPPYGEYDANTQRAAAECGISAMPLWTQSVKDGHVYFQTPEKVVQPGDILLLHFRETLVQDVLAALRAIHNSGLTPALLEDYI